MLPILKLASDQQPHRLKDAVDHLADQLQISEEDRQEMLPSGTQTRLYNRTGWAITYLEKAGLVSKPKRGWFQITGQGLTLLESNPSKIDTSDLAQFARFQEFKATNNESPAISGSDAATDSTPEELIDRAMIELTESLAAEVAESLATVDPGRFEQIVVDLLVAMGYGGSRADAAQVIGKPGDGGIDGTIKEDRLGLDVVYVQAKRWQGSVGRKEIQSFAGSLEGERASKGVFITTSTYTSNAIDYVKNIGKRIILIDGARLARLMIDHGIGVSSTRVFTISKLDTDYFDEG